MSDPKASNPSQPNGGETKCHSPVVRIVEWVVIGALGLVVANEAFSKWGYDATFANLEKAIDDAEAAGNALAADKVDPLVSGMPSRKEVVSGRKTLVDYQWRSLFKTYRIVVHTAASPDDGEMVVLSFETDAPPEDAKPAVVDSGNVETPGPSAPGGGVAPGPSGPPAGFTMPQGAGGGAHGGGAGGGPGGGQRPPLEFSALDADGDGQLVVEDLPERMRERFGDIDTDGNGTISEEEFDARPRPGADQTPAADRPELETEEGDDQAEESDDEADSDEASEETDEATEETEETGESTEDAAESAEETDEATEVTDPSA